MNAPVEIQQDCRTRLIEAATAAVLEEGYRASIERIAARAGVARQTLYNHFPTKADLFGEVVRHVAATILISLEADGATLRERLLRFALALRERVLSPETIAFYRAMAAEALRFPELAAVFYASGPVQSTARLAAVLEHAMHQGELRHDDPKMAAQMLISMLVESERTRRLFADLNPPPPSTGDAERIVDLFLRAYTPESKRKP